MPYPKLLELARRFAENGMKLMLQDPRNVRDLLALLEREWLGLIDPGAPGLVQTTFVQRDYRHIESDVVLIAPMRGKARGRGC